MLFRTWLSCWRTSTATSTCRTSRSPSTTPWTRTQTKKKNSKIIPAFFVFFLYAFPLYNPSSVSQSLIGSIQKTLQCDPVSKVVHPSSDFFLYISSTFLLQKKLFSQKAKYRAHIPVPKCTNWIRKIIFLVNITQYMIIKIKFISYAKHFYKQLLKFLRIVSKINRILAHITLGCVSTKTLQSPMLKNSYSYVKM